MKEEYLFHKNKELSKEQADKLLKFAHTLEEKRQECPCKPPYSLNFLEYYNSSETTTSWILKEIRPVRLK